MCPDPRIYKIHLRNYLNNKIDKGNGSIKKGPRVFLSTLNMFFWQWHIILWSAHSMRHVYFETDECVSPCIELHEEFITSCHWSSCPLILPSTSESLQAHQSCLKCVQAFRNTKVAWTSLANLSSVISWFLFIFLTDITHHALVPSLSKGLFISDIALHPAIGDHVTGDGRVVDG